MNYSLVSGLVACTVFTAIAGCASAADQQNNANVAQREANAEIDENNTEQAQKNKASQAEADGKIEDANVEFTKMRNDYRQATSIKLANIDREVSRMEAEMKAASGKAKDDLSTRLASIYPARAKFNESYAPLDSTPASNWDQATKDLDAQLAALTSQVSK